MSLVNYVDDQTKYTKGNVLLEHGVLSPTNPFYSPYKDRLQTLMHILNFIHLHSPIEISGTAYVWKLIVCIGVCRIRTILECFIA